MIAKHQPKGRAAQWLLLLTALFVLLPLAVAAAAAVTNAVEPSVAAAKTHEFDLRKFLAPFHSVVLHYPIGFVTLAFIIELITLKNKSPEVRKITVLVMGLAAITAIIAAALGFFRATGGEYESRLLSTHRVFGVAVTAVTIIGFFLLLFAVNTRAKKSLTAIYRVLLVGNIAVLIIAGHQGGNLTHGSNYLFEGVPDSLKKILADMDLMDTSGEPTADAKNEQEKIFVEQIRPVFQAKCYSCHGPEKQRGEFRLDQKEIAFKGGDSKKAAIVSGKPMESNLIRLLLLPADDDDVMPPKGKQAMSPEELGKVIAWIRNGAAFPEAAVTNATAAAPSPETPAPAVAPR
ncbi:MAG: hypothetical protein HY301_20025 [Verrucomicrobia bacterium]|nr:hypothetical protein [Verrucomicrobiota bacterium]